MHPIDSDIIAKLSKGVAERGVSAVASACNVHVTALRRAIDGGPVTPATATKLARGSKRVRKAEEFKASANLTAKPPQRSQHPVSWESVERIRAARDAQIRGDFKAPVELARDMRTNGALFVAYQNRIAPLTVLKTKLEANPTARGEAVAVRAQERVIAPRTVLSGIHGTLVNHAVAIGFVEQEFDEDGSAATFRLTEWPLQYVKYDAQREVLTTQTRDGQLADIRHGDGRWIVFSRFGLTPWTQTACILPAALVWAANSGGMSDWAGASQAHGNSKIMGTLPEGVPLQDDSTGALTIEASSFLGLLQDFASGDTAAGIKPFGAEVEYLSNGSTAWQVFKELGGSSEKLAARIYQGTDATLGSVGGAPGVDIAALFGVATTLLQSDVEAIEQALNTGLYEPWTAVNEGDSKLAPKFKFLIPDPDEDAHSEEYAARLNRLFATVEAMKKNGFIVNQDTINRLCVHLRIDDPPRLASQEQQAVPLPFAPTDLVSFVNVREARASLGLAPLGDERDAMTVSQLRAKADADAAAAVAPPVEVAPVATPADAGAAPSA